MKKGYIDTNIIIAYAAGPSKDPNYQKAKDVFDEVKRGNYVGVISTLTLIEVIGVLRTLIGRERTVLQGFSYNEQADYVKDEAQNWYNQLIAEILQMPNIKIEKGKQANLQSTLETAFEIMTEIKGVVKFYQQCGICGSNHPASAHKQVLAADILHALIAKDTVCDFLVTFDKGFNGLSNEPRISPLQIMVR